MSDAPEIVITATMLCLAIRAKLSAENIKRRHVSALIDAYVAPDPPGEVPWVLPPTWLCWITTRALPVPVD